MMNAEKIICDRCGKSFYPGQTNGLPNGICFELRDGRIINACTQCVIDTKDDPSWLDEYIKKKD
ncbi:MAG TPA: hypothetical protein DHV37_05995 [Erysipelotrichaceae bacterium]|nr:hypothetical protein [Erysipelotrichaceae bacterium]